MESRRDRYTLGGYFAAFMGLGLVSASVGPTLPGLAALTHVGLAEIGLVLSARSFGEMLGCLLAGAIVDRGYKRSVITAAVLVMSGCLALIPSVHLLSVLVLVFLVLGAAQGGVHTSTNTLLVWKHPQRTHSLLSVLHFMFAIGMVIAPLLIAWLLPIRADELTIYWLLAFALIPIAVLLATSSSSASPPATGAAVIPHSSSRAALYWAIVLFFFYVGAEINVGGWLYAYASQAALFAPATAAYLVAAFWGAFMVGRLLAIFASRFIRPLPLACGGLLMGIVSALGVLASVAQATPWLWISIAALGLSMAAVFPQTFAYISTVLGMSGRKTATLLIAGSGGMFLPWLTGMLMESASPQGFPVVVAISMLLALIALVMVRRVALSTTG